MIEFLFLDLDDTILDFRKAEKLAIRKTIESFGAEVTEEILHRYHLINKAHWEMLERGEMTRDQVLVQRFAVLFAELGIQVDAAACAKAYEKNLSIGHYFLPGAEEAVDRLSKKYRLFLASADLYRFFEKVFVSQEIGYNKPSVEYFSACFAQIPGFDPKKAIMVGDSLTSDILGGIRAGIATCWVTPADTPNREDIRPDHRIESITQLEALLETL